VVAGDKSGLAATDHRDAESLDVRGCELRSNVIPTDVWLCAVFGNTVLWFVHSRILLARRQNGHRGDYRSTTYWTLAAGIGF